MSQLPVDCLNEIFECLEEDKNTLHSCLLVNRLWCEVSVRILWKSVLNCNTLIACLPNESKEILHENGIIIPTQTSKPPLFNYIAFIKNLEIDNIIKSLFKNYQSTTPLSLDYQKYTAVTQEIYKSLMNQISSLRELHLCSSTATNITFTIFPGAIDCLKHLFHLSCRSNIYPGFFYQLSQICHNIQSLDIKFENVISNGLKDLISVQKNLKYLNMDRYYYGEDLTHLIPSLIIHSNTLIKLNIYENTPFSFISKFTNLQELVLKFDYSDAFKDFKALQYVTFPQLRILKIPYESPSAELLIKFLENNGKNLNEFYVINVEIDNNLLNIAVAKFCPNFRKLYITYNHDKFLETLKMIFNNCQYLEKINIWSGYGYLDTKGGTKELFEVLTKYSPKCLHELQISLPNLFLKKYLEEFFINWKNRIPLSFNLLVTDDRLKEDDEVMEVIEKYKKLDVIKRFKSLTYDDDCIFFN